MPGGTSPDAPWHDADRSLNVSNRRSESARGKKPRAEWSGGVLADGWQRLKCCLHLGGHVPKLPRDLVRRTRGRVRSGEPCRSRRVSGSTETVRSHMGDTRRLCSGSCRRDRRGQTDRLRGPSGHESTTDLTSSVKITPSKPSSTLNRIPRPVIRRRLSLEQRKNPLRAVGSPGCDEAAIRFAQRLRRSHAKHFRTPTSVSRLSHRHGPLAFLHSRLIAPCRQSRIADPARSRGSVSRSESLGCRDRARGRSTGRRGIRVASPPPLPRRSTHAT